MQAKRIDSSDQNVSKYVFELDEAVAEAVLYKYPTYAERTVMCISTQSGCPVGCRFCGAGDSFVRSLRAEEIVAQVSHMIMDRGLDLNAAKRVQIMFMSMGEPMLNLQSLSDACSMLFERFPKAALLVSTSGPRVEYGGFMSLARRIPTIGLQFSVHESTDARRNQLIPFKQKLTLAEMAKHGEWFLESTGRQPFFNYCAHEANVFNEDADRLARIFDPKVWQATISVVCERDEHVAAANARQRALAEEFQRKLARRGYGTRMFDPAGQDDIGGGCGQLWFVQDWMHKHPDLARPSVGRQYPMVHAPRLAA